MKNVKERRVAQVVLIPDFRKAYKLKIWQNFVGASKIENDNQQKGIHKTHLFVNL